jgi:hypothetical protein
MNKYTNVREWYSYAYPTDTWAIENLNKLVSFDDIYECLQLGCNVYTLLGVSDSIVRERVFEALSNVLGCDYDVIYHLWLR